MYVTCTFCDAPLGQNDVLERFPVGRRVAFDVARGRLWVVCRGCERWNLVPEDERWEIIEDCERRFRATRMRYSTENIGLCRLAEGLELVRIGRPMRPELAAWRYGDQFGRRWRRHLALAGGAAAAAAAALTVGTMAAGAVALVPALALLDHAGLLRRMREYHAVVARVPATPETPELANVRGRHLDEARILMGGSWGDSWGLAVSVGDRYLVFQGDQAVRIAGTLLARINVSGARAVDVGLAVTLLERHGDASTFFRWAARRPERDRHRLAGLPIEVRLALEMISHEETERAVLAGELQQLQVAWKEAEEIAAIADTLELPRRQEGDPL